MTEMMTEFYPGSKQKKKEYGPKYKSPATQPEPEEIPGRGGKEFLVNGQRVKLYPVGALASFLNRKPGTMRKWENEGIIPNATYVLPSDSVNGQRRLYTEEQIRGLRRIAEEEGILEPSAGGKWSAVETTQFRSRALQLFKELE